MSRLFSLFSTADIPPEEYYGSLHEMHARILTNRGYDAVIHQETGNFRIALDKGEAIEKNVLIEFEDDKRKELYTQLGGEPKTHIYLDVGETQGSQNLAVKFVAMFAERYPCMVVDHTSNSFYSSELLLKLRDQGLGFDGFDWKGFNAIFEPDEGEDAERQTTNEPSSLPEDD